MAACGCAPWLAAGQASAAAITVSVAGRSPSPPLANNYLGLALTYQGVTRWAGPASRPADPVLVQLIRNLTPHGHPVLRVGGVSADRSWWPIKGYRKPIGIWYDLTPAWAASLRGLAQAAQARLILGLNLEADRPTLVRVESHELVRRIGRRYIDSLQIGNEPNLYRTVPWYALLNGRPVPQYLDTGSPVYSRPPSWGPAAYAAEIARLLPTLPRSADLRAGRERAGQRRRVMDRRVRPVPASAGPRGDGHRARLRGRQMRQESDLAGVSVGPAHAGAGRLPRPTRRPQRRHRARPRPR